MTNEEKYIYAVKSGLIYNGNEKCDSWSGPCSCGAWHNIKEAVDRLKQNNLLLKLID